MKLLFVHHSFPSQFQHVLQALAASDRHEIVFISRPTQIRMSGVRQVSYAVTPASTRTHHDAREFDAAMRRAVAVAEVGAGLRAAGFQPDLIIGHEGWGETLNLADIWPAAPQLGYREYFYHVQGADVGCDPEFPPPPGSGSTVRAKNAVGTLALLRGGLGLTPTVWQRSLYPTWAQPSISVVPEGVHLAYCSPDPAVRSAPWQIKGIQVAPQDRVVTFVARDLEPYRGFHTLMRALPRLLARRDVLVICLGGDGVTYGLPPPLGTWRERLVAELGATVDISRVHFPGQVSHVEFRDLLRRSDIHTYLSYPFIVSWSLREAMACGCAIVAADTAPIREFITDGKTGSLIPPLDHVALADSVLSLLESSSRRSALNVAARGWAESNLSMERHLAAWQRLMQEAIEDRA